MSAKFEFIDGEKALFPIVKMCIWMGVSTSGYYEWRDRPASATTRRREQLAVLIGWIFEDSEQTYGHRRVHAWLARQGERCGPELVRAIMRELGLVACQPRPWRPTTTVGGDVTPMPDLVARDFSADAPGSKLVGDITYLPTWGASATSPRSSTVTPRPVSATRSPPTCAPSWSSTPCAWPPETTPWSMGRYSTPIAARRPDSTGRRNTALLG
ncbi:MAG TPA: IS3 family transposase [Jiangellaceae bacterium]|nr:IS3 family transposase [Jiangellaceae bacterium]